MCVQKQKVRYEALRAGRLSGKTPLDAARSNGNAGADLVSYLEVRHPFFRDSTTNTDTRCVWVRPVCLLLFGSCDLCV